MINWCMVVVVVTNSIQRSYERASSSDIIAPLTPSSVTVPHGIGYSVAGTNNYWSNDGCFEERRSARFFWWQGVRRGMRSSGVTSAQDRRTSSPPWLRPRWQCLTVLVIASREQIIIGQTTGASKREDRRGSFGAGRIDWTRDPAELRAFKLVRHHCPLTCAK